MNEWISVKERLPELTEEWGDPDAIGHFAEVIAFDGDRVFSASYDKFDCDDEGTWATSDGATIKDGISHWMPLPEPPTN